MRNKASPESPFKALSERERQVIGLAAAGLVDKQIGQELDVSVNTLRTYWSRIREKAGDKTRTALVAAFVADKLIVVPGVTFDPDQHEGWVMDPETQMVLATDSVNDLHGLERGIAYPALTYMDRTHPEALDSVRAMITSVVDGSREMIHLVFRIVTSRGVELVNTAVQAVKDEHGRVRKVYGFRMKSLDCRPGHDSSVQIGHWERDHPGDVFTIDSGLAEIIGRPGARELSLAEIKAVLPPGEVAAISESMDHAVERGIDRLEGDLRFIRPDGEVVWSRITRRIVRADDGSIRIYGTLVVFR